MMDDEKRTKLQTAQTVLQETIYATAPDGARQETADNIRELKHISRAMEGGGIDDPFKENDLPYHQLLGKFERLSCASGAGQILYSYAWIEAPESEREKLGDSCAAIEELTHTALQNDDEVGDLIAAAKESDLGPWDRRNLELMEREWLKATAIPAKLVGDYYQAANVCEVAWGEQHGKGPDAEFAPLIPHLERLIPLTREMAEARRAYLGNELTTYELLLDDFDSGRRERDIDALFADLKSFLPAAIDDIMAAQASQTDYAKEVDIPVKEQEAVAREVMTMLGFNFNAGWLGTTTHPFCGGTPGYVWIGSRYQPTDFWMDGYLSGAHEAGHGIYEQGLPKNYHHQPVGRANGLSIHESQSLFFERALARSPAFLSYIVPLIKERFGDKVAQWTVENVFNALTRVQRSLKRVDADEVTYPLHIIARYEVEKALIAGDLAVRDIPGAFDDGIEANLGIRPANDFEGCLQDAHWYSADSIAYFPTYTYGAMDAAQQLLAMRAALPDLGDQWRRGDLTATRAWLARNIHKKGSLLTPEALMQAATDAPTSTTAFRNYLSERYHITIPPSRSPQTRVLSTPGPANGGAPRSR